MSSCTEDSTPKPKGYLSLEYPEAQYMPVAIDCPYSFKKNTNTSVEMPKTKQFCWVNVKYPDLKGTLHLTYRKVDGNLNTLLKDAQNITQQHTIKAEGISSIPYENSEQDAYGMVYEIEGNAASPLQFYVTNKTEHFLSGAVYFNVKPNYDSILPAVEYLKKDIKILMESMAWK